MDRDRAALDAKRTKQRPSRQPNLLPRRVIVALVAPSTVFIAAFYLWPVGTLTLHSASMHTLRATIGDATIRRVLWFTACQATVSTLLTIAVGLVPAYLLSRFEFTGRRALTALITVPFVLPTVVVGAAFLALLPKSLDQSVTAIVIAHVFFNVAVVVRGVGGLWEQLPADLTAAARTLGASPRRAMREITLPLLKPAIFASASIVFLFTFTSFGVVRLLGGPAHTTLEVEIWQRATRFGDIDVAAVLSVLQVVVLGCAVAWFAHVQSQHRRQLGLHPRASRQHAHSIAQKAFVSATSMLIVIGVVAPIAALTERSLRTGSRHSFTAWRAVFTPGADAAVRPGVTAGLNPLASIATSLRIAIIATVISVIIGGTAALAISAVGRRGALVDTGLMLPLGTSAVTIGFGLLITFDRTPFDWRGSPMMIPLGHALVATPFVVRMLLPVLRSVDSRLRDATATLGAWPSRAWREIDLRIAARPVVIGAGFAMAISLGEFGATSFLTRSGRETLPIAIERLLNHPGALLHAEGYVLATVLAVLTFAVIGAVEMLRFGEVRRA